MKHTLNRGREGSIHPPDPGRTPSSTAGKPAHWPTRHLVTAELWPMTGPRLPDAQRRSEMDQSFNTAAKPLLLARHINPAVTSTHNRCTARMKGARGRKRTGRPLVLCSSVASSASIVFLLLLSSRSYISSPHVTARSTPARRRRCPRPRSTITATTLFSYARTLVRLGRTLGPGLCFLALALAPPSTAAKLPSVALSAATVLLYQNDTTPAYIYASPDPLAPKHHSLRRSTRTLPCPSACIAYNISYIQNAALPLTPVPVLFLSWNLSSPHASSTFLKLAHPHTQPPTTPPTSYFCHRPQTHPTSEKPLSAPFTCDNSCVRPSAIHLESKTQTKETKRTKT